MVVAKLTSLTCIHSLNNNKNMYNDIYVAKMPNLTCLHTPDNTLNKNHSLVAKMPILICVHTLYNNKNLNKRDHFQNAQSFMCIQHLQQHKPKNKGQFPKCLVLHFYISSTAIQTKKQGILPSLTFFIVYIPSKTKNI